METTTTTTATHRLKGVNSDEHTCTACGRTNLVRVAWLAPLDADGNEIAAPSAYGTDCAGRILHGSKNRANTARVAQEGYVLAKVGRWLARGESFAAIASECRLRRVNAEATATGVRVCVSGEWIEVTK